MKEEILHFIWKNKLFGLEPLKTTSNQLVEVINPGNHNTDAGPDFFNAKIRIDETLWAGNVEIHIKKSDWFTHNHHLDKNFSNIILHVIYEDDICKTSNNSLAPTLIIPISDRLKQEIAAICQFQNNFYCHKKINKISKTELNNYLEYILIERLEEKHLSALTILNSSKNCWETLFYSTLTKYFGGYTNNHAFEQLATKLPFKILMHHSENIMQLEALLFGTAGFLIDESGDEYYSTLKAEYTFLKTKYNLTTLPKHIWKFLRLRPSNFPTIRIAQLAQLINQKSSITNKVFELNTIKNQNIFSGIHTSEYWSKHYQFNEKETQSKSKLLGKTMQLQLIINVVLPFLFTHYKQQNNYEMIEKTISWLHELPSENNSIIKKWEENGIISTNTATSQSLYHLKSRYCDQKKCIHCRIGQKVLATSSIN